MKKYILPVFIFLGLAANSCSSLDQFPTDSISPGTFFRTENDLRLYTNSFYDAILPTAEGVYNESVDNIVKNAVPAELQGNRLVPVAGGGWDWDQLRNINFYLEHSPSCTNEAARNHYDGVARFFRAFFYFNKVKRFGDVPWYDHVLADNDEEALMKPRDPRTLVIDNIVADLDFAIANLPSSRTAGEISRWTALALKSRVCLWEGTFRKYHTEMNLPGADALLDLSIAASEELISDSGYSLYSTGNPDVDYRDLFTTVPPASVPDEFILARTYSLTLAVYHNVNYNSTTPSFARPGMEKRFIDSYLMADGTRFTDKPGYRTMRFAEETRDRDLRLSQSIRTPGYTRLGSSEVLIPDFASSVSGYQPIKFVTTTQYDPYNGSINPMPIFRYAEVLLNLCEAKAENGTLTQSDIDHSIKLLRDRVAMPNMDMASANATPDPYLASLYPSVSGVNKGVLLEIRRERSVELLMENFRYDDIMRWKNASIFAGDFKGMYFPGLGKHDVDGDGVDDICLWQGTRPDEGTSLVYLEVGATMILDNGTSGNIVTTSVPKVWDENKDYLWPLPTEQLLLNKNLTQNDGWK